MQNLVAKIARIIKNAKLYECFIHLFNEMESDMEKFGYLCNVIKNWIMFNWFDKKKKVKEELEASIAMLSKKRSEMTQENISLEERLTNLRKEVQKESSLLDDKRATNCALQQRNTELQKELDNLENKKKESVDYIQDKENECSILNQKQEKITESLHELEKTVSERQLEIKELDKSFSIKKDEYDSIICDFGSIRKQIRNEIYVETIESSRKYILMGQLPWGEGWFKDNLRSIGYNKSLAIDGHDSFDHSYTEIALAYARAREVNKVPDEVWELTKGSINYCRKHYGFKVPTPIWYMCNDYLKMNVALTLKKMKESSIEDIFQELAVEIDFVQKSLDIYHYKISDTYIKKLFAYVKVKYQQYQAAKEERERMAEEKKAQQEYARAIKQAQKDEEKAQFEIEKRQAKLLEAKTQEQLQKLNEEIAKLQAALKDAIERRERALSMAQQTKSGYVYVISNIGSFGEGIYKIGMTRRLDPMERIFELGNASVPFPFDVHAFIYSEDAPALEAYLHKVFDNKKVNTVNYRKEYFRTTLDEIKNALIRKGIEADFIEEPPAYQYRESSQRY